MLIFFYLSANSLSFWTGLLSLIFLFLFSMRIPAYTPFKNGADRFKA